ncbi:hypothetical protein V6615_00480 [Oscillospiraceae bacterium PP1C4]
MKWKSTNIFYLAGIGLPLAAITAFGIKIAWPTIWISIAILAVSAFLFKILIGKIIFLPRPEREYGELKPLLLDLPETYGVELYTCSALCKYDFVLRIVELLSPFAFRGNSPKVVVNPQLLEKKGDLFMKIAITREIERYQRKYQMHTILHLTVPVLVMIAIILGVFAFDIRVSNYISPFILQFAMPFLFTILFVGHLFIWNKCLSQKDFKLDSFLTSVFPVEDVKSYILGVEELERRNEKQKHGTFNDHYTSMRIKKLEKN